MKYGTSGLLLLVVLFTSTALNAAETDVPYRVFEKFMRTVVNADDPESVPDPKLDPRGKAVMYYMTESKRELSDSLTWATQMDQFKQLQDDFKYFEPMYFRVSRTGLRAEVYVDGIDNVSHSEGRITAVMLWEDSRWKFESLTKEFVEERLKSEVHTWKLGKDEDEVDAVLTGVGEKHVELVTTLLEEVRIPKKQLSREDITYVVKMKKAIGERLKEARERLEKKAALAGQDSNMKMIRVYILDKTDRVYDFPGE